MTANKELYLLSWKNIDMESCFRLSNISSTFTTERLN